MPRPVDRIFEWDLKGSFLVQRAQPTAGYPDSLDHLRERTVISSITSTPGES